MPELLEDGLFYARCKKQSVEKWVVNIALNSVRIWKDELSRRFDFALPDCEVGADDGRLVLLWETEHAEDESPSRWLSVAFGEECMFDIVHHEEGVNYPPGRVTRSEIVAAIARLYQLGG